MRKKKGLRRGGEQYAIICHFIFHNGSIYPHGHYEAHRRYSTIKDVLQAAKDIRASGYMIPFIVHYYPVETRIEQAKIMDKKGNRQHRYTDVVRDSFKTYEELSLQNYAIRQRLLLLDDIIRTTD